MEVQKVSGTDAAHPTPARDGALDPEMERRGLSVPLVPDPKVVRELLTRYASLQIALAESEKPDGARELEDVSYTLCVMTGTRRVHDAIEVADALLVAGTERESVRVPDGKHGLRWQSPLSEEAATQRAAFPGQGAAEL
jgi:hypothetical protein